MSDYVPLFVALIWPITIIILLIIFRRQIGMLIKILENRLEKGDKLTAFGVSIEPVDPKLGLTTITTSTQENVTPKSLSRIIGTGNHRTMLVAIGETRSASSYEPSGLLGIGDTLAMATVHSMFLGVHDISLQTAVVRLKYAKTNQLLKANPNIISIGGPLGNNLTRLIMSSNPINLYFDGFKLIDRLSVRNYEAMFDNSYLNGKDFGILLGFPNPSYKDGKIIVVAGIYGYGSYAAAKFLSLQDSYRQIGEMDSVDSFEALVEVEIKNGIIESPKLVVARRLT